MASFNRGDYEDSFMRKLLETEPLPATVVYDGAKYHYVPADHFFFGPVVSRWVVSGTQKTRYI